MSRYNPKFWTISRTLIGYPPNADSNVRTIRRLFEDRCTEFVVKPKGRYWTEEDNNLAQKVCDLLNADENNTLKIEE